MERARLWLLTYLAAAKEKPIRKYNLYKSGKAEVALMTDASPLGLGAILLVNGRVTKAMASPVGELDAKTLGFALGDSSSQGAALKHWGKLLTSVNVAINIQSDSVTALALTQKFSNSNTTLNYLGAELAITCSLLRGVGDGEWAGLLDLVRRNKKRPSSCATPQKKALSAKETKEEKAGRRVLGAKVRRSLGGRLQPEGKLLRGRPRSR